MLYWIYDYPNWVLGIVIIGLTVGLSVLGLLASRRPVHRWLGAHGGNEMVFQYVSAAGIFSGLTTGLIAVATWENYNSAEDAASDEAASYVSVYRDLHGYPQPYRDRFQKMLRDHLRFVIKQQWPAHQRGIALKEEVLMFGAFCREVQDFEVKTENQKITHAVTLTNLGALNEKRRKRMEAAGGGLPAVLWVIVILGPMSTMVITFLAWIDNIRLHIALTVALSSIIGLSLFIIASMDNPFRGPFSVSPDVYEGVLDTVMVPSMVYEAPNQDPPEPPQSPR